jgi:hypothetical protein
VSSGSSASTAAASSWSLRLTVGIEGRSLETARNRYPSTCGSATEYATASSWVDSSITMSSAPRNSSEAARSSRSASSMGVSAIGQPASPPAPLPNSGCTDTLRGPPQRLSSAFTSTLSVDTSTYIPEALGQSSRATSALSHRGTAATTAP